MNSKHFVEEMRGLSVEEDGERERWMEEEVLVSFDVSSMFTNVPVEE